MNHREYLKQIINEAPIAYDDETSSLIGKTDKASKTKWTEAPPIKATIDEIIEWVIQAQKKGFISKDILGQGASRMCKMNDGKSVFKFNYDPNDKEFGNQTAYEVKFFKKWGSKFSDVLVQIYKSGDNWQIAEAVKPCTRAKFEDLTNIKWDIFRFLTKIDRTKLKSMYKKAGSIESLLYEIAKIAPLAFIDRLSEKDYLKDFIKSKDIKRIIQCACETGLSLLDLHDGNLGFRGNNLVILDYGFDEKR